MKPTNSNFGDTQRLAKAHWDDTIIASERIKQRMRATLELVRQSGSK